LAFYFHILTKMHGQNHIKNIMEFLKVGCFERGSLPFQKLD